LRVCREGEAIAVAAGLYLGGKRPVVMIQCTGLFDAGDSLRNFVHDLKLPLFFLIGVRSYYLHQESKTTDTCPAFTQPLLPADPAGVAGAVRGLRQAAHGGGPGGGLPPGARGECGVAGGVTLMAMTHRQALEVVAAHRGERIVLTTMTSVAVWPALSDSPLDF